MIGNLRVRPPAWCEWEAALDRAGAGGTLDAGRLVEECLLTCVHTDDDRPVSRAELRALGAKDGDALLTATMAAIDRQRQELDLQLTESPSGSKVVGAGLTLYLRPWTFGERNDDLRRCMQVVNGQIRLDLAAYNQATVLHSVTNEGGHLSIADVATWPVPLGELVIRGLNRLNGVAPDYEATLSACASTGCQHPDLTLIHLCQTFGWTPDDLERMDASTVERLSTALQVLQNRDAASPVGVAVSDRDGEGVTRIIVRDA